MLKPVGVYPLEDVDNEVLAVGLYPLDVRLIVGEIHLTLAPGWVT